MKKSIFLFILVLTTVVCHGQAPSAPVATAATSISSGSFNVNWNPVSGATGYYLDISTASNFSSYVSGYNNQPTTNFTGNPSGSVVVYSGFTAGSTYYYRLRAINASGTSASSNVITVLLKPNAPNPLAGTNSTGSSFTANWSPANGATQYTVQYSTSSTFSTSSTVSTAATSTVISGLSAATVYYYRVLASNASGASGYSSTITTGTTLNAPVAIAATGMSSTYFIANWSIVSGATGYAIDVSTVSDFSSFVIGFSNTTVSTIPGSTSSTAPISTNISPATTYYYRLRALSSNGPSQNSNVITVATAPATPTGLAASGITQNSFTAGWNSSPGTTEYRLDVSTSSSFATFVSGYQDRPVTGGTSQPVTGLASNTTYYFRVRARNGSSVSANTGNATALTLVSSPVATSASSIGYSSFTANWNSVPGATSYRVDVSFSNTFASMPYYSNVSAAGTSLAITNGVSSGVVHYYRVRAVIGSNVSDNSNVISVLTVPAIPIPSTSNITPTSFDINWLTSAGATEYRLDVSTASDFSSFVPGYQNIAIAGNVYNITVTGLTAGTTYYYRMRSVNSSGISPNCATKIAVTLLGTPPVATAATGITSMSFTANWNAMQAQGFFIDVATDPGFSNMHPFYSNYYVASPATSLSCTNSITPGTTYYYRLRLHNYSNISQNSNVIGTITVPAAPSPTAANITATSFQLSWPAVTGATVYRVDVATSGAFTPSSYVSGYQDLAVLGGDPPVQVSGLIPNTTYFCRIRSVNGSGTSTNSTTNTVLTLLATPQALEASNILYSSFQANWNSVLGAATYQIDVSEYPDFHTTISYWNTESLSGTARTIDVGISPDHTYYYRIRAVGPTISANSNTATVTTLTYTVANQAQNVKNGSFIASWSARQTATGYRLSVAKDAAFANLVSGYESLLIAAPQTNFTVTGLIDNTTYYYRVQVVNAGGVSGYSNIIYVGNFDQNYIRTTTVKIPGINTNTALTNTPETDKITETVFYDGLGRKTQTVSKQLSPDGFDVVQPIRYNELGQTAIQYLPYTSASTDGWYRIQSTKSGLNSYNDSEHFHFFTDANNEIARSSSAFSKSIYEPTPFGRVLKQGAPGEAWQPDDGPSPYNSTDHTIKYAVDLNLSNEVLLWTYTPNSAASPRSFGSIDAGSSSSRIYYPPNQLQKTKTKDEHQNEVIEFTDKFNRIVLKKVQAGTSLYAETYYIYDDLGNLVCVLPPQAVKLITQAGSEFFDQPAAAKELFLKRWAFRYKYDERKRLVRKHVPGAGQILMVYDDRNRLVMTQDSVQRTPKVWTFTKYDALNRPVLTGLYTADVVLTQTEMQQRVNDYYQNLGSNTGAWFETFKGYVTNHAHGYDNKSYPVETNLNNYLTVTYYDSYDFRQMWGNGADYVYVNDNLSEGSMYAQPVSESLRVNGQVTGTKMRVLDGSTGEERTWLKSVNYYDDDNRLVQSSKDNYKGGIDRNSHLYDFTGKLLKTQEVHNENDVRWSGLTGSTIALNALKRTAAGNDYGSSGAFSQQQLAASSDGWMQFRITDITSRKAIGLASANPDANYTSIDYCFVQYLGTLYIAEGGVTQRTYNNVLTPGTVLKIERVGNIIAYKMNGGTLWSHTITSTPALNIDASLYTSGTTLADVQASFANNPHTIKRAFAYDHAGRVLQVWHGLDTQTPVLVAQNSYNEIGELINKKLHSVSGSPFKQSVDYAYNIRGWLTKINNSDLNITAPGEPRDLFGMELLYEQQDVELQQPELFYNGNISAIKWSNDLSVGSIKEKAYTYSYDAMNRLKTSVFQEKVTSWSLPANNTFAETGLNYDLNGNILSLQRNDRRGSGWMDNLTYSYTNASEGSGNKLRSVSDTGDAYAGFINGSNSTDEYTYDGNGNMLTDLNKGLSTAIAYNHLNLPEVVTRGNNTVRYAYDASGGKLSQITTFGNTQKRTDYVGEYEYEDHILQQIAHDEGRIVMAKPEIFYTTSADGTAGITSSNATLAPVTQNGGQKYVRATSTGTVSRTGMFPIGGSFSVTAGQTYRIRAKGYRTGTSAVHISVKVNGLDVNWPGATLANSLVGESWSEQTVTIATSGTLQAGVVWNTVTNGEQFFLNDFEIIQIGNNAIPEYQYTLKDHLGNARLTFTTKDETINENATLENANAAAEQSQFVNFSGVRKVQSFLLDHTNGDFPTTTTGYAQRLSGINDERYGLGKSISVMPGDVISAEVYAKYIDPVQANWTTALNTLIGYLAAPGSAPAGTIVDGAGYVGNTGAFPFPTEAVLNTSGSTESGPKAYLNWLVFDRNYNFIPAQSGYDRISSGPKESGQDVAHERLFSPNITIQQAGYVYIYISNEELSPLEVYFDDFKVTHTKSPVVQQDDYYAFGLNFNSYQRENSTKNQYLYNKGAERQDELDLNVDATKFRIYDPSMGRWWQLDPLADQGDLVTSTPYNYSFNNPIRYNDPEGDCPPDTDCSQNNDPTEQVTDEIAGMVSSGIKGLANFVLAPFGKELSNDGNGITLQMQEREAPKTVMEAVLKPMENALDASSIIPSSGPASVLFAKLGPAAKSGAADLTGNLRKTLKQQGDDLAKANNGNRVEIRSEKVKIEADVAGKDHLNKVTKTIVPTPHIKISKRNLKAPKQPAYNTKGVEPTPITQEQMRVIRKYLESIQK